MATSRKRGNSYQLRCFCGYDSSGRQNVRCRTWTPAPELTPRQIEKELQIQKVLFEQDCKGTVHGGEKVKVDQFIDIWLKDMEGRNKEKTILDYKILMVSVKKELGSFTLEKINETVINQYLRKLAKTPLVGRYTSRVDLRSYLAKTGLTRNEFLKKYKIAPTTWDAAIDKKNISVESAEKIAAAFKCPTRTLFKYESKGVLSHNTVNHHLRAIRAMLEYAVRLEYIKRNPARNCLPFRCESENAQALTLEQTLLLLNYLEEEPLKYRAAVKVLLLTGMRREELLGLKWKDIDWKKSTVHITRALQYIPKVGLSYTTPKTKSSNRFVALSNLSLNILQEQYNLQKQQYAKLGVNGPSGEDGIFQDLDGELLRPNTLTRWFGKFIDEHPEFPQEIHLHSLRHTNASLLLEEGVPVTTVSHELGHASTATTMNIYSHNINQCDTRTAETMDRMFQQPKCG